MEAMAAAAGSAASSIIGSLINTIGNIASVGGTNIANMYLSKYSYDQQRKMIQEQNEYNSPKNQMLRYEEAGLNPNLIYGEGKASAGNQSEIARYNAPSLQAPDFQFNLGLSDALKMKMAMEQNAADLDLKEEEANNKKMLGFSYQQDYYSKLLDNMFKAEITGVNPGIIMSDNELDSLRSSRLLRKYDLGIDAQDLINGLNEARTLESKMSAQEKKLYNEKLFPLLLRIKELETEGLGYENIIKSIDADTEEFIRLTAPGSSVSRAFYGLGIRLGQGTERVIQHIRKKHLNYSK